MVSRARSKTITAAEQHRSWLELVDTDGPFLAIPPLKRVWPNGIPDFKQTHPDRFAILADARKEFEASWEALARNPGSDQRISAYRAARDAWVQVVLKDIAGWGDSLLWGEVPGIQSQSPNRTVTVTAQAALTGADGFGAIVSIVDASDSLRQTPNDLWAATPVDRLEALLRESDVEIGIVTDGRWWGLVRACPDSMAASGIVDSLTWTEEPRTRDAFLTLIGRQYLSGGDPNERLPRLFEESIAAAEEVTEALGAQVRSAVELLIQSFAESATESRRRGLADPLPTRTHDTYEAAVTVMMRVVFLLFAEERGLLPPGELFEQGYGIARELDSLLAREAKDGEEALEAASLTWHRLLATSQALYAGASFENLRMPAYGGSLFDPDRFAFLTATSELGTLAISVSDRVMLHVLRSVQFATLKSGEARRISFRDIDVEQIGYIYEGLLGYTCVTVNETYLGLIGSAGAEPEIPLAKLESLAELNPDATKLAPALVAWIGDDQPSAKARSVAAMAKAVTSEAQPRAVSTLTHAVGDDPELRDRVQPWLGIVRLDLRNRPFVVLPGGLLVKETPSRKNSGAHYTPKSLAEEVALHALQPLCYSPGPYQTADESEWELRSSDELLDLKVADIACGSGAFLVAAARYLSDRVVEAWVSEDATNAQRKDINLRATRQVVANCLFGADINDMAIEMCKLSLWLVSLDRDLPFSFVDDKVLLGNSLLGLTSLEQLRSLHIYPDRAPRVAVLDTFDVDIDRVIQRAIQIRERLSTEIDESDPSRSSSAKRRQLSEFQHLIAQLRGFADGVIAVALDEGGKRTAAVDSAFARLRELVKRSSDREGNGEGGAELSAMTVLALTPTVPTDYEQWRPLHWILEAPDVLTIRGGFDAVVGNPPFLVAKDVSGAVGPNMREFLVEVVAEGARGKADLAAYFLRRAVALVGRGGVLSLILPKSIAEGATRTVALDPLIPPLVVLNATRSREWPTKSASTRISLVTLGRERPAGQVLCDGVPVAAISSTLDPVESVGGKPRPLDPQVAGFKGSVLQGNGFLVDLNEATVLLDSDGRNAAYLKPYLNGTTVNRSFTIAPDQYAIDFREVDESVAQSIPQLWRIVEERVKPERALMDSKKYPRMVHQWWKHWNTRPEMYDRIRQRDEVIVISAVSKHAVPVYAPTDAVLSSALVVFDSDDPALYALLSSSVHRSWLTRWGSTMQKDIRYAVSDVWNTFPAPHDLSGLESVGVNLLETRSEVAELLAVGPTALHTMVDDPTDLREPIARVREAIQKVDEATVRQFGWVDLSLEHGWDEFRNVVRFGLTETTRVVVLDKLIRANHQEAEAEPHRRTPRTERRAPDTNDKLETLFS